MQGNNLVSLLYERPFRDAPVRANFSYVHSNIRETFEIKNYEQL